jgi:RNA polymerase sigma-70 factor (ECF subfamily)
MMVDDATLSRLAGHAQRGNREAYASLLTASRDWLRHYFRRKVPAAHIDDLVQETLLSLHRKLASYDPARPFTPWLAAIGRYRFVDYLRDAYRTASTEAEQDVIEVTESPEPEIVARLSLERMFQALPEAQQKAIELVKIEGRSISEASARTGQSEALVKVNIHRGLKRLAALIEGA